MRNIVTKTLGLVMAVAVTASLITINKVDVKAAETTAATTTVTDLGTVTFSVEKFTIGQGYVVEPTTVKLEKGDTTSSVFERVMKEKGYTYNASNTYGFYLESINNADSGIVNIPTSIANMESYTSEWGSYTAPTNENNDGNLLPNKALGSSSYNGMAGWMLTLNGESAPTTSETVKNGDVVRWHFSVYAYGGDVGINSSEEFTGIKTLKVAKKEVLTKEVAKVNERKPYWMGFANVKSVYENAVKVLIDLEASQSEVDAALLNLQNEKKIAETTTPTETTKISIKKATIKSVKNIKTRKAKITVKKLKNVTGYQYKYSTSKKFRAKVTKVKTTTKSILITKKIKKSQRCYVKVRAYVKVNGKRVYGQWSKVKSAKINK